MSRADEERAALLMEVAEYLSKDGAFMSVRNALRAARIIRRMARQLTSEQRIAAAIDPIDEKVQRVLQRRRETNSSGQDGKDVDAIRTAMAQSVAPPAHAKSQSDLFGEAAVC